MTVSSHWKAPFAPNIIIGQATQNFSTQCDWDEPINLVGQQNFVNSGNVAVQQFDGKAEGYTGAVIGKKIL